eukprot:UN05132
MRVRSEITRFNRSTTELRRRANRIDATAGPSPIAIKDLKQNVSTLSKDLLQTFINLRVELNDYKPEIPKKLYNHIFIRIKDESSVLTQIAKKIEDNCAGIDSQQFLSVSKRMQHIEQQLLPFFEKAMPDAVGRIICSFVIDLSYNTRIRRSQIKYITRYRAIMTNDVYDCSVCIGNFAITERLKLIFEIH